MAIEFVFRINPEEIHVQDEKTGFDRTLANRVAVHEKRGMIVALGESDEEAKTRLGAWYAEHASEIRFYTLFDADGAGLRYEIRVLEYLTRLLHRQSQDARRMKHLAAKLMNRFDYVLEIPGYEAFPEARRLALEETLQAHLRLRRLVINEREVQIPVGRREAEFWLRCLFVWVLPAVATAVGYMTAPAAISASRASLFVYLLAIGFLFFYGGKVLWMLSARRLVPAHYRLRMLQGARYHLSRIDQWLARVLWGKHDA